ncbi:hypothetical protein ACTWP6_26910 [Mycobacterium sp. 4D054]|uniref:hypothetical protein n=1 Tax=Mycobacterium sp. 4D054 TaxID=3457440 RepID=UPI003FD2B776
MSSRAADHTASTASSHLPAGVARPSGSASVMSATPRFTVLRISRPTVAARLIKCRCAAEPTLVPLVAMPPPSEPDALSPLR